MGPNAPILPPGGAFGPKLYLGHSDRPDGAFQSNRMRNQKCDGSFSRGAPALRR